MMNNESKKGGLKVVFRQEGETVIPQPTRSENDWNTGESLADAIDRFLAGLSRLWLALRHQMEYRLLGILHNITRKTFFKLCILAIIMLFIFKKDVAFDINTPKFVSETTSKEKTYTNKHQRNDFPAPASLGNVVSTNLAPAAPEELRKEQVRAYIDRYSKAAVGEMDKFGIPASITMAQAIIESRSGTSILAVQNNNHFGIKCFSKKCPDGHCSNHTDDHHKDFFRIYAGSWESFREHSTFLMKNSYRKLLKNGKNYTAWARGLREYGYATDPTYDKKLISIIEKYELHKLDDL